MQFSLDFGQRLPAAAQERIADGMQRAQENANQRWMETFVACVLAAARKKPEITSDDVLTEIEALPNAPDTHNLSAIGPAMKEAARRGFIGRTDRFTRSKVEHKNGNLHAVWKSNYFRALVILLLFCAVAPAQQFKSKAFVALHGGGYLLGMADTSLTAHNQSCCAATEGTIFAPQNPALRALEVSSSWAGLTLLDRRLMKRGSKWWWVPAVVGIGAHAYGVYSGATYKQLAPVLFKFR